MRYKFIDENKEHLHTLDNKPLFGVTTILKELFPAPLAYYGAEKALGCLGWLHPKKATSEERSLSAVKALTDLQKITLEDYLALLDRAYVAHDKYKKEQGKKGTDVHALVEDYIKQCIQKSAGAPQKSKVEEIKQFVDWAQDNVAKFLWSEGFCYSEKLWCGGCADFGFVDKKGQIILGDLKTAKDIYWQNYLQTAAYATMILENGVLTDKGEKLGHPKEIAGFVIFQMKNGESKAQWNFATEDLQEAFANAVQIYKIKQAIK